MERKAGVEAFAPPAPPDSYAIVTATGDRRAAGEEPEEFIIHVPDFQTWDRLLDRGALAMATAFIEGIFDIKGDLFAAIRWWRERPPVRNPRAWLPLLSSRLLSEPWFQTGARAKRNMEFHYDRSNAFYEQFLDRRMVYSCAYFRDPAWTIDEAQLAKLEYICNKLNLQPDDTLLDVGCGWGGLTVLAAERYGVSAVGCTLSHKQAALARERARQAGVDRQVVVEELDYRSVPGCFDKIASIGMYEHVGRHRLPRYFQTLGEHLEPEGLLLNHGIARPLATTPDGSTEFVQRQVFPGSDLPNLGEVVRAAVQAGFEVLDVENLRLHYALTCAAWVDRLQARRHACLREVDPVTYRTWLLYLAAAGVCFERGETDLYQILLAKRGGGARFLSRAHLYQSEEARVS